VLAMFGTARMLRAARPRRTSGGGRRSRSGDVTPTWGWSLALDLAGRWLASDNPHRDRVTYSVLASTTAT